MISSFRKFFSSDSDARAHSIAGRKNRQEDACYISPRTAHGQMLLVADGVGGHAHGDYASQLCVSHFRAAFENERLRIVDVPAFLRQKVILIANEVWQKGLSDPAYHGCGTTLSGVLVKGNAFHLVHVGDSRVYMLDRSNNLMQLTRDQTLVQRLMDQGQLSPEAAKTHPQRNVMYSAIGQEPSKISIDIRGPESIRQDELLLLCSDGIHDALEDEQLREILIEHKQNSALAEILVQAAYDAGGKDNITACWYRH